MLVLLSTPLSLANLADNFKMQTLKVVFCSLSLSLSKQHVVNFLVLAKFLPLTN